MPNPTPEAQERECCPTCGSNNRKKRQRMWLARGNFGYCPDPFHTPSTEGGKK